MAKITCTIQAEEIQHYGRERKIINSNSNECIIEIDEDVSIKSLLVIFESFLKPLEECQHCKNPIIQVKSFER